MKRFLISLIIFALIITACDVSIGILGEKLIENSKGGNTGRKNHMANNANEELLIFGSSRATHHYDSEIIKDTLGLTVYNCGLDGNGIICSYGFYKIMQQRFYPKILIYEVTPSYDLEINDNHKYLAHLRLFYSECVKPIFVDVDKIECYKMISRMYRYNSVFHQLIMDNIHPLRDDKNGYRPLEKEMAPSIKPIEEQSTFEYDKLKLYYIEKLIDDCQGKTQLIFTVSPFYENTDDAVFTPIKQLCEKYDIPMISHYTDSIFNNHREYFYDRSHLNRSGATEYSKVIAHEIKERLIAQQANSK